MCNHSGSCGTYTPQKKDFDGKDHNGPFHLCKVCKGKIWVRFGGYRNMGTFVEPYYIHSSCICYHCLTDQAACFNPESQYFRFKCKLKECEKYQKIEDFEKFNNSNGFDGFETD